ncbi:MAG TPA: pirin family protein [Candidatus Polarisedimenticolia bacterium]|nr:pirin family protein [Candidatus Polarisedimenticolia bacterium]
MITLRPSGERGHFDHGWLDTRHTFSFADYHDPAHMGFRSLRVINDDVVQPGKGFGTHGHRDMEIVTYVVEGALQHKDSMGTGSTIRPGEVQRMTAGTGVLHSEFNPSPDEAVRLLQIWILPDRRGLEPEYEQRAFSEQERRARLRLVASPDGRDGSVRIHQDAELYASILPAGSGVEHPLAPGRHAWVQMVRGSAMLDGVRLDEGDGAALSGESAVRLRAGKDAELLLFDLA